MAVTQDKSAPYAPVKAILGIIERSRNSGLAKQITPDVLVRLGISDSLIPRTLQSLRVLDLTGKDGTTTDTFEKIRSAPDAEYQQRLEEWLNGAYADVFKYVDPSNDDEKQIRDAFRPYKPHGQQDRMVALFYGLCAAAGISKKPQRKPRIVSAVGKSSGSSKVKGKASKLRSFSADSHIPPALAGILNSLPPEGTGWTKGRRNEFVAMFGTVLDFCIPINGDGAPEENNMPDMGRPQ